MKEWKKNCLLPFLLHSIEKFIEFMVDENCINKFPIWYGQETSVELGRMMIEWHGLESIFHEFI